MHKSIMLENQLKDMQDQTQQIEQYKDEVAKTKQMNNRNHKDNLHLVKEIKQLKANCNCQTLTNQRR